MQTRRDLHAQRSIVSGRCPGRPACQPVTKNCREVEIKWTVDERNFEVTGKAGYGSRTRLTALGRPGTADIPIPRQILARSSASHPILDSAAESWASASGQGPKFSFNLLPNTTKCKPAERIGLLSRAVAHENARISTRFGHFPRSADYFFLAGRFGLLPMVLSPRWGF